MNDVDATLEECRRALVRWRRAFEAFTSPATHWIVQGLAQGAPLCVLDLACGIGDPALALAAHLSPSGRVVGCDRVAPFVHELQAYARQRGLSNLSAIQADLECLPLAAASVDCVVSRFGLQFCRDPAAALAEIRRVLKPNGQTCHVVWAHADQPLLRITVQDVLEACGSQPFASGVPGPFQFALGGSLSTQLVAAGFQDVVEQRLEQTWRWPGSAHELWRASCDTSASLFEPLFARLTSESRRSLDAAVIAALECFAGDNGLLIPVAVHCVWARNPNRASSALEP